MDITVSSLRNPNKIRSLFAFRQLRTWSNFHAGGRSGYRFLADRICAT